MKTVCTLTSQHLWTSQDPASNGYNLLRLKEISLYRDWLFSMAQRSVPPVVPLLGCFYWEQLEAEVPVLAAGVQNLWQSRHKWQKELCFLHRNLCVSSFRDTALRSDGWARTAEHSSLGSTVVLLPPVTQAAVAGCIQLKNQALIQHRALAEGPQPWVCSYLIFRMEIFLK